MGKGKVEPGKLHRRERVRIFYDILSSIIERELDGAARITRVQSEVNLPSDRLRFYLKEMTALGLVEYGETLRSTERGRAFVAEYEKIVDILKQFGLL